MTLPLDLATDKWQQNFRLKKKGIRHFDANNRTRISILFIITT